VGGTSAAANFAFRTGLAACVGIEKQKLNNIMKKNRNTTVQDIGVSPHSGKPLVSFSCIRGDFLNN